VTFPPSPAYSAQIRGNLQGLLNRFVKFAMQMTKVSSTIWSSLKYFRSAWSVSSRTAEAPRVTPSAYAKTACSCASKTWLPWEKGSARSCASVIPACFAEAVCARLQYAQPLTCDVFIQASSLYLGVTVPSLMIAV
jgi:hypothetical protein